MKIILQKADNFKESNKIIEINSFEINNNSISYFAKSNETIIIKYSDTEEQFLITDIQSKINFDNSSESLIIIQDTDLIPLGGSSGEVAIPSLSEVLSVDPNVNGNDWTYLSINNSVNFQNPQNQAYFSAYPGRINIKSKNGGLIQIGSDDTQNNNNGYIYISNIGGAVGTLRTNLSAPTPTTIGKKGNMRYVSGYMYVCVETNTWVRYLTETSW